jgi:HEAT repeat protein
MDIEQIKVSLNSENPQDRLRGVTALRHIEAAVAAPILLSHMDEAELMVRSLIITGLGHKRTDEGFTALLAVMSDDVDPNIRAEAAGAISKYGPIAVPHLIRHSYDDQHWLSQMSIVLALPDLECPDQLLEVCTNILHRGEVAVQIVALEQLPYLVGTGQSQAGLDLLLKHTGHEQPLIRRAVAMGLRSFDAPEAKSALLIMRQDPDHRVVAASLETLLAS